MLDEIAAGWFLLSLSPCVMLLHEMGPCLQEEVLFVGWEVPISYLLKWGLRVNYAIVVRASDMMISPVLSGWYNLYCIVFNELGIVPVFALELIMCPPEPMRKKKKKKTHTHPTPPHTTPTHPHIQKFLSLWGRGMCNCVNLVGTYCTYRHCTEWIMSPQG